MNKLSFSQKNDLVVKHKAKKHFGKDLELFQKHCPSDRLMNDVAKANEFTFERLDGQMLYILLDKISIDEILKNREEKAKETTPPVQEKAKDPEPESFVQEIPDIPDDTEPKTSTKKKASSTSSEI